MPLAEVKTLYQSNARNVPEMLRKLAADIEEGVHGQVEGLTSVMISGKDGVQKCDVFAFGDLGGNYYDALGILAVGTKTLTEMI